MKDDTISRQAAIDATWFEPSYTDPLNVLTEVRDRLKVLPSAQSETAERTAETAQNVSDSDLISRKAAIDAIRASTSKYTGFMEMEMYTDDDAVEAIEALPPAQPAPEEFEWCRDCKEYDQTAHCCHRWTKAIRKTVEELEATWPKQQWILCSEKLPKINQTVLLSTTDGEVIVGYRYKPDIVWQVTANDGQKIWVYDPENYSGNIDELPKAETCGFENRDNCWLSVTSINYDKKFAGISAWMPLPEPYREDDYDHT